MDLPLFTQDTYHVTNLPTDQLTRMQLKQELLRMVGSVVRGASVNLCSNGAHADIDVPRGSPMEWLRNLPFHGILLHVDER